jgi:hypothetical protein
LPVQNKLYYSLNGFSQIADSAEAIIQTCNESDFGLISGYNFKSGNWNTHVHGDDC